MDKINAHIKNQQFNQMYLLCGEDEYMKNNYRLKLMRAIVGEDDGMNLSVYSGDNINIDEIISVAQTLPFFAQRRLIVIEDSGFFLSANELSDFIESFPDTTYFVFVEKKVDKRSKMYKTVKSKGYVCEMNGLKEPQLLDFIAMCFNNAGIGIRRGDAQYLLQKTGNDMNTIKNECEKIIAYIWEKKDEGVTRAAIDDMCSVRLEDKVFEMIDDLAFGRRDMAMKKYSDLLALREAPLKILRLIVRHFNILLLLKEAKEMQMPDIEVAQKAKIPSFALRKYNSQLAKYDKEKLIDILKQCVELDERFKMGNISDQIAVDILLCTL